MSTQPLDALRFPLHGSGLIEASAGTGKTWTIAALYLRLVLGDGDAETGFGRPLLPAEILVMTFTRAATRELSDRIRARLLEAARCFRGETTLPAGDAFLEGLFNACDEAQRKNAAWRLAMAAEAMDDSAISTIDAWCQRMLREHAFDSGNAFDEELDKDQSVLGTRAAQDYWRQHFYPLSEEDFRLVSRQWATIDNFVRDMKRLVDVDLPVSDTVDSALPDLIATHKQRLTALADGWVDRAQDMKAWIDNELNSNKAHWNGSKLHPRYYDNWFQTLEAWAADPIGQTFGLSDSARNRLTPQGMLEARTANAPKLKKLPQEFEDFATLLDELAELPKLGVALRQHAAQWVRARLAQLKRQARSFGFADQLERLHAALHGPNRERLRARIIAQYPVALIDEFQDTSALQYEIFDALYRTQDDERDTALLLIGDPKQSIYGFRDADIYSYLRARRATAGRHYRLDTNYRSTEALVAAVNACFAGAETRNDEAAEAEGRGGAFRFRSASENPLPFEPVQARGRGEVFQTADGAVPALTIQHALETTPSGASREQFAAHCAERIIGWLNDPQAGFRNEATGELRRVRPADIAVLVRKGSEAAAVRHELSRRGLASVYLSEKESVFASAEAQDLLHWLRAAATPQDSRYVRAALATAMVGLPLDELARLAASDAAFEVRSAQMHELHRAWRELGVLAMLRRSLHVFDLPARWLESADGERRLTNFLHLAELLQQASVEIDGEQALIRWLAMQVEHNSGDEEQVLRLESDADLVKVVTIFKSKGLEYPLVCLPFSTHFRAAKGGKDAVIALPDDKGGRRIVLDCDAETLAQADDERLREDIRLLYVALTRARHALWMGFSAISIGNGKSCESHRSAAGCVIGGPQARDGGAWLAPLQALAKASSGSIVLEDTSVPAGFTLLQRQDDLPVLQDAPGYAADFERNWTLGSFSALTRNLGSAPPVGRVQPAADTDADADVNVKSQAESALSPTASRRPAADEVSDGDDGGALPASAAPGAAVWHRFTRGSLAGDFIHDVLEWLESEDFALASKAALQDGLRGRCERAGHGDRASVVQSWMEAVLATPLPSLNASLPQLHTRLTEMEFWMPCESLAATAVDALCTRHLLGARPRPPLAQRTLHGMLMGFADLVFEHDGRYWVLDYKSNWLGDTGAAYDRDALEAAMAKHRYDVQAALYLLALHRLLRARLGENYVPKQHLGGALYFFVRGIDGPCKGEYALPADDAMLELLAELDRLLDGATAVSC